MLGWALNLTPMPFSHFQGFDKSQKEIGDLLENIFSSLQFEFVLMVNVSFPFSFFFLLLLLPCGLDGYLMALEFSILIMSLLSSVILGFSLIFSFLPSRSNIFLPVVVIPPLSGSSNYMGVMRNDEQGLDDDAGAQREQCRLVKMETILFLFFLKNEMGWMNDEQIVNMKWMDGLECCGDFSFAKISSFNHSLHSLK